MSFINLKRRFNKRRSFCEANRIQWAIFLHCSSTPHVIMSLKLQIQSSLLCALTICSDAISTTEPANSLDHAEETSQLFMFQPIDIKRNNE